MFSITGIIVVVLHELIFINIFDRFFTTLSIIVADDLPVRGFIGHLDEEGILPHRHKMYLYTRLHFVFEYNGENVRISIIIQ